MPRELYVLPAQPRILTGQLAPGGRRLAEMPLSAMIGNTVFSYPMLGDAVMGAPIVESGLLAMNPAQSLTFFGTHAANDLTPFRWRQRLQTIITALQIFMASGPTIPAMTLFRGHVTEAMTCDLALTRSQILQIVATEMTSDSLTPFAWGQILEMIAGQAALPRRHITHFVANIAADRSTGGTVRKLGPAVGTIVLTGFTTLGSVVLAIFPSIGTVVLAILPSIGTVI
ncbi:MAG TPA: hypothetical protein DCS82_01535, partial [Rhodospirillaceae bacterium]|nr:hypothetical protein [Rhodospirillaceae bacterium]